MLKFFNRDSLRRVENNMGYRALLFPFGELLIVGKDYLAFVPVTCVKPDVPREASAIV
jgi:hypothetical protein